MSLVLDSAPILIVFFIATRIAGMMLMSPVLGFSFVPARVRVLVVLMLAMVIAAVPGLAANVRPPQTATGLVLIFATELALGAVIGFAVQSVFAALELAGQVMDLQIGFGAAALFDPTTQAQTPLLSALLTMSGAALFLMFDGHHELLRALAHSFQLVSPGRGVVDIDGGAFITQFGLIFVSGFVIAAPVVLGLMLADIAIGVVARTMPQVNVYFVTLPIKIFLGMLLLMLSLAHVAPVLREAYASIFAFFGQAVH